MDKTEELQSRVEIPIKVGDLTADHYAVVEDTSAELQEELPELKRLTLFEVVQHRLREIFVPHGERFSFKEFLRRLPGMISSGVKAAVLWPISFTSQKWLDFLDWIEIQKALVRHRRRRRERIRNLSKIRTQNILRMLEDDPLAFDRERPKLKGRELLRWYWLIVMRSVYSMLEVFTVSKQVRSQRALQQGKKVKEQKGQKVSDGEPRGLKALAKRWNDYWANVTRKENHGLFIQRKDSKLRLSKDQWRKLESVYARARRLMNDGNYEEAIVSFESCISLLGRNTGDSIYEGLGICKLAVFEKEVAKKPLEWIKQESHDVSFCFQQANWVNPNNPRHSRRAADAQRLGEMWEDNHRELAANIDRLGFELGQMESKYPNHAGLAAARRELYNAKVSLSVWGYADAEKIVIHCRELLDHLQA